MSTEHSSRTSAPARTVSAFSRAYDSRKNRWLDYVVLLAVFVTVSAGVIVVYPQYYPDSAHYLAMSLWFGGMPRQDALQVVYDMHITSGFEPNTSAAILFDWGLVKPRVVFPALAMPLVLLLGPSGMIVTTLVITFVFIFSTYEFLERRYRRPAALIVVLLAMSSMSIMLFSLGMLTESLSAVWGLLALVLAYRYQRNHHWGWLVALFAVTTASAFTRQATLIVAGAFVVAFVLGIASSKRRRDWMWPAVVVASTAIGMQLLQTALWPFSQADQYERMTGTDSLWGAIQATPALVKQILTAELRSYVLDDIPLITLLVVCAISLILFWKRSESHLLIGALLAIALYNITNGNPTHFRYALPGLIFFLASAALLVDRLAARPDDAATSTDQLGGETPRIASPRS